MNQPDFIQRLAHSLSLPFVLARFLFGSFLSFLIDISIFAMLHFMGYPLLLNLFLARAISGVFNFYINKFRVYKAFGTERLIKEIISYISLALIIFVSSFYGIAYLHHQLGMNMIIAKVLMDSLLFMLSFSVQGGWVFIRRLNS